MELDRLANLAEVIGVILVVGGFVFAVIQLQQFKVQRRAKAAMEVARTFQTAQFTHALRRVQDTPRGVSAEELRQCGPDCEDAAMLVSLTLESIGLMVYRHMVSLDLIWELMGGTILDMWERLERWSGEKREELGQPKYNEWVEWLVGQLKRRQASCGDKPAYELYKDWRPLRREGPVA